MTRRQLKCLTCSAFFAAIPIRLYADAAGPPPGFSGVPGEFGTCAVCHSGGSGSGSVNVTFPNGLTYAPGVSQNLVVTVADPSQRRWGFQLTARQSSSTSTEAGTFSPGADGFTQTVCATSVTIGPAVCSSSTVEYIEHTLAGTRNGTTGSVTFQFTWTPPPTNSGNLTFYVAANAANGDGSPAGDHIYTALYTLTPAVSSSSPTITANGVVNGASFQQGVVPGSWATISGSNLSAVTDTWANAIVDGKLPENLDGVSVTIGSAPAYIYYISPGQINLIVPPDLGPGPVPVTVTNSVGTSAAVMVTAGTFGPAFFPWPNNQAVATHQDFSLAAKAGTFAGVTTVAAKPGEVIILWGTGFGPTIPVAPAGVETPSSTTYSTSTLPTITLNNLLVTVDGAALAPGFAGLYQVAIQVPSSMADGDWPVEATIGGVQSPSGVVLTVQE
jgi:uncharacterized protein (TIGR03437 family)